MLSQRIVGHHYLICSVQKYIYAFSKSTLYMYLWYIYRNAIGGCRGHDRMVDGFKTTYAISAYHHWRCEFESRSGDVYSIQQYVINFVSDLRQVGGFLRVLRFSPH